jgi:IS30 family transposase
MDERLRALIEEMPEKPPRSKLEPHLEVIRELRRKRRTYQEIARFLADHLNVTVAASTIHAFVRVRARHRQKQSQVELPPARAAEVKTATTTESRGTAATDRNIKERIEAVKRRRPPEKPRPRFEYDENEPLQRLVPGQPKQR